MQDRAPGGAPVAQQTRPKVEIGWILEGDLLPIQRDAARAAAAAMEQALAHCLPGFTWVFEILERQDESDRTPVEPVQLLDSAEIDRDVGGWDFALVVSARRLHGRERSRVLGITSGIFATGLMSTAFLAAPDAPEEVVSKRLHALAMHIFGMLNGLVSDRSDSWTRRVDVPEDLDDMEGFDARALEDLAARMEDVADLRVEEMQQPRQGRIAFYARSLWQNRSALPRAILRMRPWDFPLRLRRLTTAAGSALAVLVMTAESWEVAANLTPATVVVVSVASVLATSAYLLKVQRLLARRQGPLREQRAVSNAATVIAVTAGLGVTWLAICGAAWLMATGLFGDTLVARWTGASMETLDAVRGRLAALAATLGVAIGALGASFEPYGYIRHVTHVDEEI